MGLRRCVPGGRTLHSYGRENLKILQDFCVSGPTSLNSDRCNPVTSCPEPACSQSNSSQSQSYIILYGVCLGVRHPSGTRDQFFPFPLWLFFRQLRLVDVGCPLWREVGSVVFSFCRASPTQPFLDLSSTGLINIFYCLYFLDSPNLEGQVHLFIYLGTG
jgi:hypothetical protein